MRIPVYWLMLKLPRGWACADRGAPAASPRARPTRTMDVGIRCQRMKTARSGRTDLLKRALGDLRLQDVEARIERQGALQQLAGARPLAGGPVDHPGVKEEPRVHGAEPQRLLHRRHRVRRLPVLV